MSIDPSVAIARFGLGAQPQTIQNTADVRQAALAEISDRNSPALGGKLSSGAALFGQVRLVQQTRRATKGEADPEYIAARRQLQDAMRAESRARIARIKSAPIGYHERLVAFWTNHFAIATSNQIVRALAGAYEREAIRPHVLGRFEDLLVSATQHPAMLLYLDNAGSIGPNSRQGQRRDRGLNENHARELLELHTLGVDGGYSQADVTSLAHILTGWTVGVRPAEESGFGAFVFRAQTHEPGAQTVLARTYAQRGAAQGKAVLADLAAHPATADHIALKLARHFIADVPPPDLVESLADTFRTTDGDLLAVSTALLEADVGWTAPRAKLRTPQEFLWATIRALDVSITPQRLQKLLGDLGQPLWNPPSPAGYKDDVATWLAPDAMTNRLDAAQLLASDAKGPDDPRELARLILGASISEPTMQAISRAESRSQGIALLLMSPEFQRR